MQFLYNENREVVAEKDYSGNIIRYIRGLGLISSDSENAKTYYHYVCDEQGSVSRIIRGEDKENGAAAQDKVSDRVLNHYEYDAFGNTISCEERVANRFRYQSGRESSIMDYSNRFADSLAEDFNPGVEVRDVVKEDMILVQFSSDAPNASLRYWTTIDEANGISTIEEYMDKMALSKEWGNRNVVKVARVKKGTEVTHAIGKQKEKCL